MKFQNPLYEAWLVTHNCALVLLVNGVFTYCNYRPGSISTDWPR